MKISKNISLGDLKEKTFDAIVAAIFEELGTPIEEFQPERTYLVSMDGAKGADYEFDFGKFGEGPFGQLIVIKDISQRILGKPLDPRKVVGKVKIDAIEVKETVATSFPIIPPPLPTSLDKKPVVKDEVKFVGFSGKK